MKKVLVAAFALVSLTASAQKNSLLIGGDVSINSSKGSTSIYNVTDETKSSSFTVSPLVGYQFSNHFTAGISFGIGGSRQETTMPGTVVPTGNYDKTSIFNVGPFVRYSKSLGNIFAFFAQGNFNYLSGTQKNAPAPFTPNPTNKYNGVGINLFPAIGVNVKNGFALNFSFGGIGFSSTKWKDIPGAKTASSFDLTFGQQVNIGVSKNIAFGKKK